MTKSLMAAMKKPAVMNSESRHLFEVISRVSGEPVEAITGGGRRRPLPTCRWLVGRELVRRGYSENQAAAHIGLDHATFRHGRFMLEIMHAHPKDKYAEERLIEREFLRAIDSESV